MSLSETIEELPNVWSGNVASLQSKVLLFLLWAFCFLVNFKKDTAALVIKDRIKDVAAFTNGTIK